MSNQSVRKYMYLVTEHEDEERVGCLTMMDSRMSKPLKNEEALIRILDEDKEGFRVVGKRVGMGYHDFNSEADYNDSERVREVIEQKLAEIDEKWLQKAGVEPEGVTDE